MKADYKTRAITTLKQRRKRRGMIEVHKIMTEKELTDGQHFFEKVSNVHNLRRHTIKLYKDRSRLDIRKHSFSNRVFNE